MLTLDVQTQAALNSYRRTVNCESDNGNITKYIGDVAVDVEEIIVNGGVPFVFTTRPYGCGTNLVILSRPDALEILTYLAKDASECSDVVLGWYVWDGTPYNDNRLNNTLRPITPATAIRLAREAQYNRNRQDATDRALETFDYRQGKIRPSDPAPVVFGAYIPARYRRAWPGAQSAEAS